jgi:amino acid adenylation domain-containing protein
VERGSQVSGSFGLLAGQAALLERLRTGQTARHHAVAARASSPIDRRALGRALAALAARHPALRTELEPGADPADPARQRVRSDVEIDFAAAPPAADPARLKMVEQAALPFDLYRAPLFRVRLVSTGAGDLLLLVFHPLIADSWSVAIAVRELVLLYDEATGGPPAGLAPLGSDLRDFVRLEDEQAAGARLARLRGHWRDAAAGALPRLDLPTDRPRGAETDATLAARTAVLDAGLPDLLRRLGRRHGANLFLTLLAAFAILLRQSSGQERFALGCPLRAGRGRRFWGVIGPLTNLVALRIAAGGEPSVAELLARVGGEARRALADRDLPWAWVAQEPPAPGGERAPFPEAWYELRHAERGELGALHAFALGEPGRRLNHGPLALEAVELPAESEELDLELVVFESADGLSAALRYRRALFDAVTVERLLARWLAGLRSMVGDPARPVHGLPWLAEAERHQLLVEWTATGAPFRDGECLHEWFDEQAARTPEAAALWHAGRICTYAELWRRSNQLGHFLRRAGVGPETIVGVCAERSLEMVVGLLGVLKAGGAYLPLDPDYPPARLEFMVEDARTPLLLTQEALLARLPELGADVLCLDRDWERIEGCPATPPRGGAVAGNLAYVIYTSGSTGRPKGVMVPHRGVLNLVAVFIARLGLDESSRVLQFCSLSFDVSVRDVFECLLAGGCLVLASRERLLPGAGLFELLRDQGVTAVTLPPSTLANLAGEGALPRLRTVTAGGEACGAELVDRWAPGRRFFNAYGPTETTVCSVLAECRAGEGKPAIGWPLANTELYVLDRALDPAGAGVVGELYIGGIGVSRGYLGRPELTAERFLPDEWSGRAGDRVYRTGDLVRYRCDGQLDYLGRTDQQVKVRGFRIELGEVEAVLASHPKVREAAVVARPGPGGGLRLVAYVVGRAAEVSRAELRVHMRARLPEHMVPSVFVPLAAMPLTGAGKVDRRALPEPVAPVDAGDPANVGDIGNIGDGRRRTGFTAPRGELEQALAGLYAQLLGIGRVGVEDDFFDLGGHSLLAAQLLDRVRERLGVELPLALVQRKPTVAALALEVERRRARAVTTQPQSFQETPR